MLKHFTPFLIVLAAFITGHAQDNPFEKGYIIQNNDTIQGYIKSASDLELSKFIEFKPDLNTSSAVIYSPTDISEFHFTESKAHFASVKAEIIKGSVSQEADRFAKQLLRGYTNLYKLQLPEEEQATVLRRQYTFLYVLKKGSTYYTLGTYETQNGDIVRTNKRYIGVLRVAFLDCETYVDNLDQLKFDDKSIITEVIKYNTCRDQTQETTLVGTKIKPVVKHGPEVSMTKLYTPENKINYNLDAFTPGYNNSSAYGFAAGYFWDITQPDKSRKYTGKLGVTLMYYAYEYDSERSKKSSGTATYIRFPFSVQYNLKDALTSATTPFLNVGFTTQFALSGLKSDIVPLPSIGFGMYHKRMRYSFLLENDGLSLTYPKILNFSVGMRLDK
ncbi:hypothetical protein WG947_02065 [Pontibacter sp. H259]|uniref:hypothetical protein n=1 Tax=Pontibacter sp. H259 TaxID=3133421 RepID=UPI0030BA6FE3